MITFRGVVVLMILGIGTAAEDPLPFDGMFVSIGDILREEYYDHERFRPRLMVERACRALEAEEATLELSWRDDGIAINHAGQVEILPAGPVTGLAEAMALLQRVSEHLRKLFPAARDRELAYTMANGALATLDPHTVLLPPRPASLFKENIRGRFFGIGAYLNQRDGIVRIERVMPGLPADRAGVMDGDIVLRVGSERIVGLSLDEVVRRIKGEEGTQVVLTLERMGVDHPIELTITRAEVTIVTTAVWRAGAIGYIRMDEFNDTTDIDLVEHLNRMVQWPDPIRGFVLDLRFNGGGLLRQAFKISNFFLPPGFEVVRTVEADGRAVKHTSGQLCQLDVPMIVLVSPGSASASEILAGALQINGRAVIAGERTFGKGSVQTVKELPDKSQLKYTIQEYQLAGGVSIQERGVEPDLALFRHQIRRDGGIDLVPFSFDRESDQEFALLAHGVRTHATSLHLGWVADFWTEEQWQATRISSPKFHPDQQAALVIDLLQRAVDQEGAATAIDRARAEGTLAKATIELLRGPVALLAQAGDSTIAGVLTRQTPPITWGEARALPADRLTLTCDPPATLVAGQPYTIAVTLTNAGSEAAGQYFGLVRADDDSPFWEQEVLFGTVPASGACQGSIAGTIPRRLYDGEERFTIDLYQSDGREPIAQLPVHLRITAAPRPHFSYAWQLLRDGAEGGLVLDAPAVLRLTITNDGVGDSLPATLYVFKDDDPYVQLGEGRCQIPALVPGGQTVCDIPLTVTRDPPPGMVAVPPPPTVKLQLRLEERFAEEEDGRYRAGFYHQLELPRPTGTESAAAPFAARVGQPAVRIATCEVDAATGRCRLVFAVEDDNPSFVSVFRNEDKVDLLPLGAGVDPRSLAVDLPLDDGLNRVSILVTDADRMNHVHPLRLWRDAPSGTSALLAPRPVSEPSPTIP